MKNKKQNYKVNEKIYLAKGNEVWVIERIRENIYMQISLEDTQ